MKPAGADVFDRCVDVDGDIGERVNGIFGEFQLDVFGLHQRLVLPDKICLGLRQDASEVVTRQCFQFDANRQAPLQFRQKIGGFGGVEGSRRDKQNMVGLHASVPR